MLCGEGWGEWVRVGQVKVTTNVIIQGQGHFKVIPKIDRKVKLKIVRKVIQGCFKVMPRVARKILLDICLTYLVPL